MLNIGIIGIGNTGNQIAKLGHEELACPALAINSSEKDLETIGDTIPKILISDKEGLSKGAGKDRALAKKYLKESIMKMMGDEALQATMDGLDIVFVVSSTGGGTGSGTAPLLANIISETYADTKCILVGVLPVNNEALSAHVNSLEYLNELYNVLDQQTYMLYDNDRLADMPNYQILDTINKEIVSDFKVLRCDYNYVTKYDSIDDRDMMRLISFPGRLVVARVENFKEKDIDSKDIEDLIIEKIKTSAHADVQRDKKIVASGVIVDLNETLITKFDNNVPKVRQFIGDPIHAFNHISVNSDRKLPNNVFYIMSGLSPVNSRMAIISDRIEEIEEAQKAITNDDDVLTSIDLDSLSSVTEDKEKDVKDEVHLKDIFNKFM